MNRTDDKIQISLDDAEDLTLYADEEFDTDDVDLFEFTSLDDSPLTLLKSIIISLDWEISDEILQSLIAEIQNLNETFTGDKIVQIYLQGLDKIARYIRQELSASHPNAIKLLNTYYYDLEKIISSPNITNEEIISLLKNDARKFKILQYQVNADVDITSPGPVMSGEELTEILEGDEQEALRMLKASMLDLDWEINDTNLRQFTERIENIKQLTDNYYATLLLNGLESISSYISDEKAETHPETFSVLYMFYDSLVKILLDIHLDNDKAKEMVVDCISNMNHLKTMVADRKEPVPSKDAKTSEKLRDTTSQQENSEDFGGYEEKGAFGLEETEASTETSEDDFFFEEEEVMMQGEDEKADQSIESDITAALSGFERDKGREKEEPDSDLAADLKTQLSSFFGDQSVEPDIIDEEISESPKEPVSPSSRPEHAEELILLDDDAIRPIDEEVDLDQFEEHGDLSFDELDMKRDFGESMTTFLGLKKEDADQKKEVKTKESITSGLREGETSIDVDFDEFDDIDINEIEPALADNADDTGFREEYHEHEVDEQFTSDLDDKLSLFFGEDEGESSLTVSSSETEEQEEPLIEETEDTEEPVSTDEIESEVTVQGEWDISGDEITEPQDVEAEELQDIETEELQEQVEEEEEAEVSSIEEEAFPASDEWEESEQESITDIEEGKIILFGDEEVAKETVTKSAETVRDEETLKDEAEAIIPALSDKLEEIGFSETEETENMDEDSVAEIEQKLSSYFSEDMPVVEADQEEVEYISHEQLSQLKNCINEVIDTPSNDRYTNCFEMIRTIDQSQLKNIENIIITHLLKSVLSIREKQRHERLSDKDAELLNFLTQNIQQKRPQNITEQSVIVEAITRFTDWNKNIYESPERPLIIDEKELIYQTVAKEVKTGFDKICNILKLEIDTKP